MGEVTRSGFIALAGRPNVGKSTLVNALVGQKVAIVSDKPQTTRRAIRGVATRPGEWQLVLTDLPGVQRPRDALTERMQRRVEHEFEEADAVLLVLNGEQGVGGAGDRFIAEALRSAAIPAVIAVNKIDRLDKTRTVAGAPGRRRPRPRRRGLPDLRRPRQGHRPARRAPRRARARGAVPVPARGDLRPARARAAGRAGARAGAAPHPPGGPARGRGARRRDHRARRPRRGPRARCGWRPSPRRASSSAAAAR